MFEDNPFYTIEFIDNDEEILSIPEETEAIDNPTTLMSNKNLEEIEIKQETETTSAKEEINKTEENLSRNNVIEPEKKEEIKETKSTGVSTYTEVPDINKETIECNTNLISNIDKFNLWLVFATFVFVLANLKKRKFTKTIEKTTQIIQKHCAILNIIGLGITFYLFTKPNLLGTGISGKLNIFTMFEFIFFIILNASLLTFLFVNKLKTKGFIFKNKKYTFSGIHFLEKSLLTFSLTGLLFFLFTESRIALIILYIFTILTTFFFFLQKKAEENELYINFIYIISSISLALLGGISGLFIIMLIGATLTGYYYPESKKTLDTIKELNKE